MIAASGMAWAQSDQNIETVVVTGSLIQRNPGDMPTPTVVLSADTITKTGAANIYNVLDQLPQVQSGGANLGDLSPTNSNFLTSGFGVSNVDLRELGSSRTLVLINGRRQVTGSPTGSAVDLNTIPTALISRIEVITGGASAVYGSDAVAGVINIILKNDFQGIAATASTGISVRGDAADTYGVTTVGGNFADGRGNVTVSVSYEHSGSVMSKNRDLTSTDMTYVPGLFPLIGKYSSLLGGAAYSSYGLNGRFTVAKPLGPNGQVITSGSSYNPDGTLFVTKNNGFDRNPNRYIQVPVGRKIIAETGHYDITDWLTFFLEATYAETNSSQQLEPYPGTSEDGLSAPVSANGTGILIPRGNPFIPAALQTRLALASNATSPGLFFYRRFADLGDRTGTVDRNMGKVTFGFDGDLHVRDWKWTSYYEWGRTSEAQTNGGYYDKIKMEEALNARLPVGTEVAPAGGGGYVCVDAIARAGGCVPINLFGAGSITPEAAKYVGSLVAIQDWAEEQVGSFSINGSAFDLPAGAVKLAFGAEYRRESADFKPDAASQAGTVAGNKQPETQGAFDVKEVFAEGILPVLKDEFLAQYLELNGAVRFAHYSTAGNAISWRYGATYQPFEDLKFRGTESSATRAPNISELYSPAAQTFPGVSQKADPCIAPSNPNVIANCHSAFALLGAYIAGEPTNPSYQGQTGQAAAQGIGGYVSGNPNLKPETAHTLTYGGVYTPAWLPGLSVSVDWYDIRVKHIIGGLSANSTMNACYFAPAANFATNIFCQQIIRAHDSLLGPIIKQINFPTLNLGSVKTNGLDGAITYGFDLGQLDSTLENAGSWSTTLDVNYLGSYLTDPGVAGTVPVPGAGSEGLPHFRAMLRTTFTLDPVDVTTTVHYVGGLYVDKGYSWGTCASGTGSCRITPIMDGNAIPAQWTIDLHVSYDVTKAVQLYVGANNLFDTRPPVIYPGSGYDTTGTGTDANTYDPIGLYLYAGVHFKM